MLHELQIVLRYQNVSYTSGMESAYLFAFQQCIKDESWIRQHMTRQGMNLLHAAGIGSPCFAHVRNADVVERAISPAP